MGGGGGEGITDTVEVLSCMLLENYVVKVLLPTVCDNLAY